MNTAFVHSVHPAATVAIELGYVTSEISVTDFILGRITQGSPITDPPQPPWHTSQKFTPLNTQETEKTMHAVNSLLGKQL